MTSTLRRQVDALRYGSSGTRSEHLQRKKGKPSLLLTPDQAAEMDTASIREAAVVGLMRLEALDPHFSPFQASLFSAETEITPRELHTRELNERIDKSIASFLALLSPHFSSREAHLCLEYLIRHYKIYKYNVTAVVECCLPWHDTVAFARLVQLLDLKGSRWQFLTPVQKSGSPIPREALARRCARDEGLLRFVCSSARRSAALASAASTERSGLDSTVTVSGRAKLFSFYAAIVVETLDTMGSTRERVLRAILPDIVHGLSAVESSEYQMASYMILSSLASKGPLSAEVTSMALSTVICKPCRGGMEQPLMCALAVVQSQIGFKKTEESDGASSTTPLLSTTSFRKLSSMPTLADILADLSRKFDSNAFIWLLLQSYVEHLPDEGAEHGTSLLRLCTYPNWPPETLQRLIRRLVDRMLKSYLAIAHEAETVGEGDEVAEKKRRASAMGAETSKVLGVLGQRYPQDVDGAVSKVSRYVSNVVEADAGDEAHGGGASLGPGPCVSWDKALSSLLSSTFAGASLSHRAPLEHDNSSHSLVRASLLTALEHPSADVRVRALRQLGRALEIEETVEHTDDNSMRHRASPEGEEEELGEVLLRRLCDVDPKVVVTVTSERSLVERMLRRASSTEDPISNLEKARDVASSAWFAADRWLSSLSKTQMRHTASEAGKALGGLLSIAQRAAAAAGKYVSEANSSHTEGVFAAAYDDCACSALCLVFECLPGPHAMSRLEHALTAMAKRAGRHSVEDRKVRKNTIRYIGRQAIKTLQVLPTALDKPTGFFAEVEEAMRKEFGVTGASTPDIREGAGQMADDCDKDLEVKSETLQSMCTKTCKALTETFLTGTVEGIEVFEQKCTPGARWVMMEALSGAVSSLDSRDTSSTLASLLVRLALTQIQSHGPHRHSTPRPMELIIATTPQLNVTLAYLATAAPHLPQGPGSSYSLLATDHLSMLSNSPLVIEEFSQSKGVLDRSGVPTYGDALVAALGSGDRELWVNNKTRLVEDEKLNSSAWESISAMVLQGRGKGRAMFVLAALCVAGTVSQELQAKVVATRALYIASTLVQAAAAKHGRRIENVDRSTEAGIVAVFPTALLALACEHKDIREAGHLLLSSIAAFDVHPPATASEAQEPRAGQKRPRDSGKSTHSLPPVMNDVSDEDIFPLTYVITDASDASKSCSISPLNPPRMDEVIACARAHGSRCSDRDIFNLNLHLAVLLCDGDSHRPLLRPADILAEDTKESVRRYLVAWGARLAWRNEKAAAMFLGSLNWASESIRECCSGLVRHHLGIGIMQLGSSAQTGMLNFLLSVLTSWACSSLRRSNGAAGTPSKKRRQPPDDEANPGAKGNSMTVTVYEARAILRNAIRTPGRLRTGALEAIITHGGPAYLRADENVEFLRLLVEAGLDGEDGGVVAAASKALEISPANVASFISKLLKASDSKRKDSSTRLKVQGRDWTSTMGGVLEFIQSMGGSDVESGERKKRREQDQPTTSDVRCNDPGQGWDIAALQVLTRPLFDAIPYLLVSSMGTDEETSDATFGGSGGNVSAEYALWLTMDVLVWLLRCGPETVSGGKSEERIPDDAEKVLSCVQRNPSPQTRGSALKLLSAMTERYPACMASRLSAILDAVGNVAARKGTTDVHNKTVGEVALRQTQRAVKSIVPALKAQGARVGIDAHRVVQVFVMALEGAPVHARRALFGTLVDSLGNGSLVITSCLLLRRTLELADDSADMLEFVHQTCHFARPRHQIQTLVKLVQACHRIIVRTAEEYKALRKHAFREAVQAATSALGVEAVDMEDRTYEGFLRLDVRLDPKTLGPSEADDSFMSLDLGTVWTSLQRKKGDARGAVTSRSSSNSISLYLGTLLSFVKEHLVSKQLVGTIAIISEAEERAEESRKKDSAEGIQEGFLLLCEELLLLVRTLTACENSKKSTAKGEDRGEAGLDIWGSLRALTYSVLEALQSLLSVPSFVAVTQELLQHQDSHLRRKALQMFSDRLDPAGARPRFTPGEESLLVDMLPALRRVALGVRRNSGSPDEEMTDVGISGHVSQENDINRQTALLTLDVLARSFGRQYVSEFVDVLDDVTNIIAGTGVGKPGSHPSRPLLSSAFLLVATLCAVLGVRAFPHFPKFFPAMLDALESDPGEANIVAGSGDGKSSIGRFGLLWTSALSAVGASAASLPTFLSPYLGRIMTIALRPAAVVGSAPESDAAGRVLSLMAGGVEPRLLVPAVLSAYSGCLRLGDEAGEVSVAARGVTRLFAYAEEVMGGMDRAATSSALPHFTKLLTHGMDFRRLYAPRSNLTQANELDEVDSRASTLIVSLVMKLSEVELRPLFLHLCEWKAAISAEDDEATLARLDRRISFYKVLNNLAGTLKSIFTPYFTHVMTDCCEDLEAMSKLAETLLTRPSGRSKRKHDDQDGAVLEVGRRRSAIAHLVLSALRRCFQFDRSNFVDKSRFDVIMPALVSQLDCGAAYREGDLTEISACRTHAQEFLGPSVAQLALASAKDVLWKALVNAVLLRSRSERAGVRLASLVVLRHCFEVVGEEFLALLPECLPFLSELLEDGHQDVEAECRSVIKYIENILGESIESYLS